VVPELVAGVSLKSCAATSSQESGYASFRLGQDGLWQPSGEASRITTSSRPAPGCAAPPHGGFDPVTTSRFADLRLETKRRSPRAAGEAPVKCRFDICGDPDHRWAFPTLERLASGLIARTSARGVVGVDRVAAIRRHRGSIRGTLDEVLRATGLAQKKGLEVRLEPFGFEAASFPADGSAPWGKRACLSVRTASAEGQSRDIGNSRCAAAWRVVGHSTRAHAFAASCRSRPRRVRSRAGSEGGCGSGSTVCTSSLWRGERTAEMDPRGDIGATAGRPHNNLRLSFRRRCRWGIESERVRRGPSWHRMEKGRSAGRREVANLFWGQ